MKKSLSFVLAVVMLLAIALPAFAADTAIASTMRISSMSGTVSVKNASGKSVTARNDMRLYNGYGISTGKDSCVYIKLDDSKAIKLDALTSVTVKKNGKKLEVQVVSGSIFFNVTEPLKGDESLNIRTTTMVTGIRGTSGIASVKPAEIVLDENGRPESAQVWDEQVQLYTGHAEIVAKVSIPVDGANVSSEELEKPSADTDQSSFSNSMEKKQELENIFRPSGNQASEAECTVDISAGETVVSRSLGIVDDSEKYEVEKVTMVTGDIPSVALEEIIGDEELKNEVKEQAPQLLCGEDGEIDSEKLESTLEENRAAEAAALEKKEADLENATAEIKTETVQDQVFDSVEEEEYYYDPSPASGSPSASDPASGSSPSDPTSDDTAIVLDGADAAAYLAALNTATATSITVKNSTITLTAINCPGTESDIASDKAVTLVSSTMTMEDGVVSNVYGTLTVDSSSTLTVDVGASLNIYSTDSVHVAGSALVKGALAIGCVPDSEDANAGLRGLLEITGTMTWSGSEDYDNVAYGQLIVSGTLNMTDKDLNILSGSSVTVGSSAVITNAGDSYIYNGEGAVMTVASGAEVNMRNMVNCGTLNTAGNIVSEFGSIENYGVINVTGGEVCGITSTATNGALTAGEVHISGGTVGAVLAAGSDRAPYGLNLGTGSKTEITGGAVYRIYCENEGTSSGIDNGYLNITGGNVINDESSEAHAIEALNSVVNISGGTVSNYAEGKFAVRAYGSNLNITNGTVENINVSGSSIYFTGGENARLTINDAAVIRTKNADEADGTCSFDSTKSFVLDGDWYVLTSGGISPSGS